MPPCPAPADMASRSFQSGWSNSSRHLVMSVSQRWTSVRPSTARRLGKPANAPLLRTFLERDLPQGDSIFSTYPHTVVSLDYIKSERHRDHFMAIAPECVIVDEAHTCAASGQERDARVR